MSNDLITFIRQKIREQRRDDPRPFDTLAVSMDTHKRLKGEAASYTPYRPNSIKSVDEFMGFKVICNQFTPDDRIVLMHKNDVVGVVDLYPEEEPDNAA